MRGGVRNRGKIVEAGERHQQRQRHGDQPADGEREHEADARPRQDGGQTAPAVRHGAAGYRAANIDYVGERREAERQGGRVLRGEAVSEERGGEKGRQPRPDPEQLPVVEGVGPDRKHALAIAQHGRQGAEQRFAGRP